MSDTKSTPPAETPTINPRQDIQALREMLESLQKTVEEQAASITLLQSQVVWLGGYLKDQAPMGRFTFRAFPRRKLG